MLGQNPAYRATLLSIRWVQVKTALTFLHFCCTSCYITCRKFRDFYGESAGKAPTFLIKLLAIFDGDIKAVLPLLGHPMNISNAKAKSLLGINFIPTEVSIKESAAYLIKSGKI